MIKRRTGKPHHHWKRYLTVIAVLFTAALLSATLYKIRGRSDEGTRPLKNASNPTMDVLEATNLLFKSEAEIVAASHEEQMQAAKEYLLAFSDLPNEDIGTLKVRHQRLNEIWRKDREIQEGTIAKYQAHLVAIEQSRKERAAWNKAYAERKKVSDAQLKEAREYMTSNFRFDANGEIIAYKTRNGVFRPVSELLIPKQDIEWDETSERASDGVFAPTDTPIEPSYSETIPDIPQTPQREGAELDFVSEGTSFVPDTFRGAFTERILDWNADIDAQYADVLSVSHLSLEEFDEYFPTEASREQLQTRQQQMQARIAQRVQRVLTEDTGNREEKLSIIRETLSKNWGPDIADGILEKLQ